MPPALLFPPVLVSPYVAHVTFCTALFVFMFHGDRGMVRESESWV